MRRESDAQSRASSAEDPQGLHPQLDYDVLRQARRLRRRAACSDYSGRGARHLYAVLHPGGEDRPQRWPLRRDLRAEIFGLEGKAKAAQGVLECGAVGGLVYR